MSVHRFAEALGIALPAGGPNVSVRCPKRQGHAHGDRNPSCSLNTDHGAWQCHGCGESGGAYDLALLVGRTPAEAMRLLEDHGLVDGTNGRAEQHPAREARRVLDPDRVRAWRERSTEAPVSVLDRRGWTHAALWDHGVGWDGERFVFVYRTPTEGLVGAGHYLPDGKPRKMLCEPGMGRALWPWPLVREGEPFYLVEGEADALTLLTAGFAAAGLPGWTHRWSDAYTEAVRAASVVVLVPDADAPGRKAMEEIRQRLSAAGVKATIRDLAPDRSDGYDVGDLYADLLSEFGPDAADRVLRETVEALGVLPSALGGGANEGRPPGRSETGRRPVLDRAALHGVAGVFVQTAEPHTEADPVALLLSFLAAAGNVVGAGPHVTIGADSHPAKVWPVLVGPTSAGRKGSSLRWAERLVERADPEWKSRRASNVGSGEALVWEVRDGVPSEKGDGDPGVLDKRLWVTESEFSGVLRVAARDGSILSGMLRQAWDQADLAHTVKSKPARATGAHITVIGHITPDELRRELRQTDAANGFGNRFLWALVRRSKSLPRGGTYPGEAMDELAETLAVVLGAARQVTEVRHDETFWDVFTARYDALADEGPGLAGAMLGRGAPYVHRLALTYALLDGVTTITAVHARAALAVWDYCAASVQHLFGGRTGDARADEVLAELRAQPEGMTTTEVRDLLGRNHKTRQILEDLERGGLVCREKEAKPGAGRNADRWYATTYDHTTEYDEMPSGAIRSYSVVSSQAAGGESVVFGRHVVGIPAEVGP
jgi:hypothetical protein